MHPRLPLPQHPHPATHPLRPRPRPRQLRAAGLGQRRRRQLRASAARIPIPIPAVQRSAAQPEQPPAPAAAQPTAPSGPPPARPQPSPGLLRPRCSVRGRGRPLPPALQERWVHNGQTPAGRGYLRTSLGPRRVVLQRPAGGACSAAAAAQPRAGRDANRSPGRSAVYCGGFPWAHLHGESSFCMRGGAAPSRDPAAAAKARPFPARPGGTARAARGAGRPWQRRGCSLPLQPDHVPVPLPLPASKETLRLQKRRAGEDPLGHPAWGLQLGTSCLVPFLGVSQCCVHVQSASLCEVGEHNRQLHFIDGETEAERGKMICPRHTRKSVAKPRLSSPSHKTILPTACLLGVPNGASHRRKSVPYSSVGPQ